MNIKKITILSLVLVVLVACTSSPAATTPTLEDTPIPTDTPAPSPTTFPTETATSLPPTDNPTPQKTAAQGPAVYGPTDFPDNVNPLTGLVVTDPDLLNRRPLSVKVQTYPRGQRPPFGISLADIVFDYYQNFGLTRFNAIFYGNNAERVSPIRSARLPDIQIVEAYKAIFTFGSADSRILSRIMNSPVGNRLITGPITQCPPDPMCRVDQNRYNFLIADTAALSKYTSEHNINNERPNLDGMFFTEATPTGGEAGNQVYVRFNANTYLRWDYDEDSGRYLRFVDDETASTVEAEVYEPMIDGLSEEQLTADNVVVLFAQHEYALGTQSGLNEIIDIQLSGSGEAYAFRNGKVYEVTWNRTYPDGMLALSFADGSPYPYKPGNTWYEVIGVYSETEETGEGAWRYTFFFP